jgi:hypothetical protein
MVISFYAFLAPYLIAYVVIPVTLSDELTATLTVIYHGRFGSVRTTRVTRVL